jgi:spore coat polysaccharide biosynthesis protein SpsF
MQARMGSTRLPGKVMMDLCGKTVLEHDLLRLHAARRLDTIVVATTIHPRDDRIAAEARRCGAGVFRGSEEDVLARYYHAAIENRAEVVVRITSDCPLFDPALLDAMLDRFFETRQEERPLDYLSNTFGRRTFPRGLDAEIFTFAALERAFNEARQDYEREHVTPYLHQHPEIFRLDGFCGETDNSHYRWTLDTKEDLELIRSAYRALYREGEIFSTRQALELMATKPQLAALNAHVEQKKLETGK